MEQNQIKVGDILAGTWGYSMVIPAFFRVVKITPKRIKVVEYDGVMVSSPDGYNQQGYEMPDWDKPQGERIATLLEDWGEPAVRVASSAGHVYARLWDGQPVWADYCD